MPYTLSNEILNLTQLGSVCQNFGDGIRRFGGDDDNQTLLIDIERKKLASLLVNLDVLTRDLEELPSLGVVGKLASGKTSCVELLLGSVGALGACQQTGTINAVEYNVVCVETDVSTTFENWRCEFMSEEELKRLIPSYRDKIKSELANACRDGKNRSVREFALNDYNLDGQVNPNYVDEIFNLSPEKKYWKNLYEWTVALYGKLPSSEVPNLCKSLIELYLFAESAYFGREWFGKKCRISAEQGKRLSILDSIENIRPKQATNNEFPSAPRVANEKDGFYDVTRVANYDKLRYLVKIIRVDVKAPQKTSGRFAVGGRLRLVDVPGLGSDRSSIRDKALLGETLPELNGVLFVFDVNNRADLSDGVNMLNEVGALDRTVLVCSKFDLLELPRNKTETGASLGNEQKFDASLDTEGRFRFQNWDNFNDLLVSFENNFSYNYSRFAPFSAFYFLGRETNEIEAYKKQILDGKLQDLFSDYADHEFLNNPYGKFRQSQSERITLAKGLEKLVETLRNNCKPNQKQLVDMLESFYQDGGVSRLVDAYGDLLRNAAAQNRLYALNDRLEKLYNAFNEIEASVQRRRAQVDKPGQNVSTKIVGESIRQIKNWSENIWEPLKLNVDSVVANNANIAKRMCVAYLSVLPIWDRLYECQWTWTSNDYALELGDSDYQENGRPLCNAQDRPLPQDTEELFVKTICGYYAAFADLVCNNLVNVPENSSYRSLGEVFDDLRNAFKINDDELRNLQTFCDSVSRERQDLIDSFGIIKNKWLDRRSGNYYSVLSKAFQDRCANKINEKRSVWKSETWLKETYPLQLRREKEGVESSEKKRVFPWSKEFQAEFRAYLGANPMISRTKLSSERIRELKYQLLKSCDYLIEELYNAIRLASYVIIDNMKRELDLQIERWEQLVSSDSNNDENKVEQGYVEPQILAE